MLEELYSVLKSQTKVYQMDDHLELPQFGFQIYWSESLDYPGTHRFFIFEDDYQWQSAMESKK